MERRDADVAGHHALAGNGFKQAQDVFAFAECVRKPSAPMSMACVPPDEVRVEAAQFGQQHAHPLRLGRISKLSSFQRRGVAKIVGEWIEVVDAVGERNT